MNKIFKLSNPNGTLVKSAWLSESAMGATLNVQTLSGSHIDGFKTLRGAKQFFGTNYQKGGKWEIDERST